MYCNLPLPIVILSTPRVGSTALFLDVVSRYIDTPDLVWLNEPITGAKKKDNFIDSIKSGNFIIKAHALDLAMHYPESFKERIKDCSLIRIRRRNKIEQYISMYIAISTGNWGGNLYGTFDNWYENLIIPYNETIFLECINRIFWHNLKIDSISYNPNFDLYYEDLGCLKNGISHFNSDDVNNFKEVRKGDAFYKKNPRIQNYEQIKELFASPIVRQLELVASRVNFKNPHHVSILYNRILKNFKGYEI